MSRVSYQQGFSAILPYRFDQGKPCGEGYIAGNKECKAGKGEPAAKPKKFQKYCESQCRKKGGPYLKSCLRRCGQNPRKPDKGYEAFENAYMATLVAGLVTSSLR